ncbi:glycosyltransferase family 4 protein [Caulobacter soli]|uniref:glycosyltransferase family 4 protein n=1 Tax=Caulobacter soli TaxID=2708539 RepID=UPI00196A4DC4|nr:glycosyltransferase family 1 protein [Caulobacter soli]
MNSLVPHARAFVAARPEPAPAEAPQIVLDLSRLLSRLLHATPTGVDRVEMAYARTLLRLAPDRLRLAAIHPLGWHGRLPAAAAVGFLKTTQRRWSGEAGDQTAWGRLGHLVGSGLSLAPRPVGRPREAVYLHLSARGLERTDLFRALLRRERARFVPFVHDLIPLTHPEYARPGGAALYARKIATVTSLASAVVVNSRDTARALAPYLAATGRDIPVHVAPLAPDFAPDHASRSAPDAPPYFVALGTIEPRKNHLLLLNVWRRLAQTLGPHATPRLVLIGRRGWENENVLDLLDRCPLLRMVVTEHNRLPDLEVRRLVAGARALLMPSFAEGYGLPVAEALALGTPVVASDLPALRETGGAAPDYLDPLDGPAWSQAALDYTVADSPRRRAQLTRLRGWRAPTWDDHVAGVLEFLAETAR